MFTGFEKHLSPKLVYFSDTSDCESFDDEISVAFRRTPLCRRLLLLILISLLSTNVYFAYHSVAALSYAYIEHHDLTGTELGIIFASTSFANMIMSFWSGKLVHRVGVKTASLSFNLLVFLGNLVIAIRPTDHFYIWAIVARFLFGLGSEGLICAQTYMLGLWYKDTFLLFSFGFSQIFVHLLGAAMAFLILPPIEQEYGFDSSFWAVVLFCAISLAANLFYILYDNYYEWNLYVAEVETASYADNCAHVKMLSSRYWQLAAVMTILQPVFFIFCLFGPLYLTSFNIGTDSAIDTTQACQYISVLFLARMLSPIWTYIVDVTGWRSALQCVAAVFVPGSLFLLAQRSVDPIYGIIMMGLSYSVIEHNGYSIIAVIVPEISLLVGNSMIQNLVSIGVTVGVLIVGVLWDNESVAANNVITGLAFWSIIGLLMAAVLFFKDWQTEGLLLMPKEDLVLREADDHPLLKPALTISPALADLSGRNFSIRQYVSSPSTVYQVTQAQPVGTTI